MADYATLAEARAFGIPTPPYDAVVNEALTVASRVVDNHTGRTFETSTSSTKTFYDVRNPIIPVQALHGPFSAVTSVTLDGVTQDASNYQVDTANGTILLYRAGILDVDGFPRKTYTSLWERRGRYGSKVTVTATFGYSAVPADVKRATLLLATHIASRQAPQQVDAAEVDGISSLSVEGYSVVYGGSSSAQPTTGVPEADELLAPYRRVQVG